MSLVKAIREMGENAKQASRELRAVSRTQKDTALDIMAKKIQDRKEDIIRENRKDISMAREKGLTSAMIDRLNLDDRTLKGMVEGLREVAALTDPVGEITGMWKRPNGLVVGRIRIPIGVIGFIYESRPNVTVDAAALCLKSGNAVILKGGSEAIHSNIMLGDLLAEALKEAQLTQKAVQVVPSTDREAVGVLLDLEEHVDLIIPRGGEDLIRFVTSRSRIPVLKHYRGVCHVYVDESADLHMAEEICFNAKVQRPGVCNAMETMLVHERIAKMFLPLVGKKASGRRRRDKGLSQDFGIAP